MRNRKELLEAIIQYDKPAELDALWTEIAKFGWDCEKPLVQLENQMVIRILQRYLNSDLTAEQVGRWADAIEVREDLEQQVGDDDTAKEILHRLANSTLDRPLSPEYASELVAELSAKKV